MKFVPGMLLEIDSSVLDYNLTLWSECSNFISEVAKQRIKVFDLMVFLGEESRTRIHVLTKYGVGWVYKSDHLKKAYIH